MFSVAALHISSTVPQTGEAEASVTLTPVAARGAACTLWAVGRGSSLLPCYSTAGGSSPAFLADRLHTLR